VQTASCHDATPEVYPTEEGDVDVRRYFGSPSKLTRGPQAYRSTFRPGYVIEPHFHRIDQFQIFVEGTAQIGKHPLHPVCVHYADGFTPYGPIVVGPEGMAFFNLRSQSDTGAFWMPGSKKHLGRKAGRGVTADTRLSLDDHAGPMRLESLIGPTEDGLAAYEVVAGQNEPLIDQVAAGSGRYQLVLEGSLNLDGVILPADSVTFSLPGEALARRKAGEDGVRILELQLPAA
jgi:hypothetical protein